MLDSLGDRMKMYESKSSNCLTRKQPVVIRLDGKAFHTFTKSCEKPFDYGLRLAMALTTLELCNQIQGSVIGYTQSDEISIILQDWRNENTDCWYGYNVQKIVSVSSSICTATFNSLYKKDSGQLALFDSRTFNLPDNQEVHNYLLWRIKDCIRNSINTLGQSHFSHKQLHGVKSMEVRNMLRDSGNPWEILPNSYKYGDLIIKNENGDFNIVQCHDVNETPEFFTKIMETL